MITKIIILLSCSFVLSFIVKADDCDKKAIVASLPVPETSIGSKGMGNIEKALNSLNTPVCIDAKKIVAGGGSPEKQIAQLMKDLSDEEVFTRLILSEMLASTCPSQEVATGIAWVLKNRVNVKSPTRFGVGRDVVFKDYQFRSSTGNCDVAMRNAFLCPTTIEDQNKLKEQWAMAQLAYKEAFEGTNESPIGKSVSYFFFKHFDKSIDCGKWKGVIPKWATKEALITPKNLSLDSSCIQFYK